MSLKRRVMTLVAPLALLSLAACATPFKANVSRFQAMPGPAGQSFVVKPTDPKLAGTLEFQEYASDVAAQLQSLGYQPATNPQDATLIVSISYGVDKGQQKIVTRPGFPRYAPYWGPYRSPYYWGWADPYWYDPFGYPEIDSYTVYTSQFTMTIDEAANGRQVFEGSAKARSTQDSLPELVPKLITAMFTNFPGHSGEEVRITVPPPPRR